MAGKGWRAWTVPRQVLLPAAAVAALLLVPLLAAYWFAGVATTLAVGMGYLASFLPAFKVSPLRALGLAVIAAMSGAVAVGLRGDALAAACFVALTCLLVAPANQLQDSLLAGIPTVAAVLVAVPGDYQSGPTALWMLAGSAVVIGIATRLGGHSALSGIEPERAWRHAIVMAVSVGVVVYLVELLQLPHGYWAALTMTVVLRPFRDATWERAWHRVVGTIGGVLLALAVAILLPPWAVGIALAVGLVLTISYSVLEDYPRMVMFSTPLVVLLGSSGSAELVAIDRALMTLAGAGLAALVALGLARYEAATGTEAAR